MQKLVSKLFLHQAQKNQRRRLHFRIINNEKYFFLHLWLESQQHIPIEIIKLCAGCMQRKKTEIWREWKMPNSFWLVYIICAKSFMNLELKTFNEPFFFIFFSLLNDHRQQQQLLTEENERKGENGALCRKLI